MHYVMTAIGMATVTAMLWKAFGRRRPATRRVLAPDDDPDFLRGLNRHRPDPDER